MRTQFNIVGHGYAVGSEKVCNQQLAARLGLNLSWFEETTGIIERRVCGPGEDVMTLAVAAAKMALRRAGLLRLKLRDETRLIYIQNGYTYLTPPGAIILASELGLSAVRTLGIDGVCAETVAALEIASLLLNTGQCERVIIVASVDFVPLVDPQDKETAGLFGAGAGAIIIERTDTRIGLQGLAWKTDATYWNLGTIPLKGYKKIPDGLDIRFGFYEMQGRKLARRTLQLLPQVVATTLHQAAWDISDIDVFISHQPNAKMVEIGARQLGIDLHRVVLPVRTLGNMGPASLLVALSLALEEGTIKSGNKVLLLAFGLGISCGSAAILT